MADLTEELIFDKSDSFWHSHREKFAWLILILNLSITFYFWKSINNAVYKDAETRFTFRTEGIRADIEDRMRTYEQVLRSGIGLFKSSENVTRSEWKNFTKALQVEKEFPGIQGIGFSLKITPEDKEEHIRQIQAEGFPNYQIKPAGEREEYTSIIYLEPFDTRNQQAFGYDMFSQVVRREAMEKARDTGETAITGRVTLVQEIDENVQSGFLVYLPLYKKGMPIDTLNQRRIALHGYVYSPFRITNLMRGILGPGTKDIDFEIYDGDEISDSTLMFDSNKSEFREWDGQGSSKKTHPMFNDTKVLNIHGHLWSLGFKTLPSFEASIDSNKSTLVLVLGGIFSLLCFVVIHGAFTTRKKALQYVDKLLHQLKNNEERLRYALDGTNDGIWDWNVVTGEVYFSPRAMTMLGYEPLELEGNVNTWENLTHPDDKQWVMNALNKHLENKTPVYETEHRLKTKSGEYVWVLDRGKVISRDEDGKPLRMTGCHSDITLRKKAAEELQRHRNHLSELVDERTFELNQSREKLHHADKLTSLGKLVGSVAHEFNNPLYGVINLVEQLGDDLSPKNREKFSKVAKKECWRMADMIKNLQNFYKPSEDHISSVDLNKLVDEVLLVIGKDIKKKGIKIKKEYCDNLAAVKMVEDQIKQVVINLMQNASDAISESDGEIRLSTEQSNSHITLKIQDTGEGISEENIKDIFDPFYTTKGVKGTGLGLSVSYGIIKKHGGDIKVKSEFDKGSTFTITIPIKENP
jgi:PAS domain S-box-containing protein